MISEKTRLPLGFVIFLMSMGIGLAGAAAVAQFRISATADAQSVMATDLRDQERRVQKIENSFEYIQRSLEKIDRKLGQ